MPLRNMPIRRKLMLIILLTSGTVLLLTCVMFFVSDVLGFRRSIVEIYSIRCRIIAVNSTAISTVIRARVIVCHLPIARPPMERRSIRSRRRAAPIRP